MRLRDDSAGGPDRDPVAVVHAALDAGITMVDTADAYQNEELIGRTIRGRRDEVLLASKFGLVWRDQVAGGFDVRADPSYVRQACEASLQRLGVDMIDLYYLHHRSETTPIEETVGAMAELVGQGKMRYLGLSNVTADDLRRAHAVHPIAALQEQWSLDHRAIEHQLLPVIADLGTVVVAHSPTSHGLLHQTRSAADEQRASGLHAAVDEIGGAHGRTGRTGLGASSAAGARCTGGPAPRDDQRRTPTPQRRRGRPDPVRGRAATTRFPQDGIVTCVASDVDEGAFKVDLAAE
ncbi:aldo/keto reductase [Rhodococcus sp. JS3073]|uniref:aldo/keto reductase n=1 Tax=Rhodococcus sp. JS3073 TaxID=3002901 RepID=UPI002285DB70|nr:aldo/keto reductase [Rhodococcus sp. JS3073]WAM15383.1 aldo/keto reductase [Rhodococcus sp. JS3073]